ncbi:MAG: hypothetical protein Q8742_01985 [Candidatus Phytoplasma australasiaticum]|nr:hypothetical protein [Candidatus Phytoplasma australasiaticum]
MRNMKHKIKVTMISLIIVTEIEPRGGGSIFLYTKKGCEKYET